MTTKFKTALGKRFRAILNFRKFHQRSVGSKKNTLRRQPLGSEAPHPNINLLMLCRLAYPSICGQTVGGGVWQCSADFTFITLKLLNHHSRADSRLDVEMSVPIHDMLVQHLLSGKTSNQTYRPANLTKSHHGLFSLFFL